MSPEQLEKLLVQVSSDQQRMIELLNTLTSVPAPKPKDTWDKFQIVSSFIAGVLLVSIGGVFTYWYKLSHDATDTNLRLQQTQLARIDLISKFMPYLAAGEDLDTQRSHAVDVLGLIGDNQLALFIAGAYPSRKVAIQISKLQSAKSEDHPKNVANVTVSQEAGPKGLKTGHTTLFDGFKDYAIAGFNFETAKIVPWGTDKPDLEVANPDPEHKAPAVLFLENDVPPYTPKDWPSGKIPANAGIRKMPQETLEAVREAPQSGYEVHYKKLDKDGVYCIRSWDGQHYAKIKITALESDRIAFDWVYQPSGARTFE